MDVADLLGKLPWFAWVAIAGIIAATITSVQNARNRHAERMALIKAGRDPSEVSPTTKG